ncbi:Protein of unknown function [Pyronema omphalodes CBS 100304]|uniref:Uncharacterized protein n=1 Tax=Pyronema omphalodes (strain CBS 100304) TaxID=1076935 RepID=U4LDW0_PYROM|nr:Protein of unknown function [Pyronema omphalodes CBS 100304]
MRMVFGSLSCWGLERTTRTTSSHGQHASPALRSVSEFDPRRGQTNWRWGLFSGLLHTCLRQEMLYKLRYFFL